MFLELRPHSSTLLLLDEQHGLELRMYLSLPLDCELLKGHKELCLINLGTPTDT